MKNHCHTLAFVLIVFAALCQTVTATAQKRRIAKPAAQKKAAAPTEDYSRWRETPICRVLIADSVTTATDSVLAHIPLPAHLGRFIYDRPSGTLCHENDFADQRLLALPDTAGHCQLYRRTLIGEKWGEAERLTVQGTCYDLRNPFPMPDGQTLYFAARDADDNGERCLSLYTTTYDPESDTYLAPQRLPYPFRSNSDDLYYIDDEADTLSWLVTTRRQPQGQVCIYTMRAPQPWIYHDADTTAGSRLKAYALIERISDTWENATERQTALQAIANLRTATTTAHHNDLPRFVINDRRVVSSPQQLTSEESRTLYTQYLAAMRKADTATRQLDEFRRLYHNTPADSRAELTLAITQAETQQKEATAQATQLAKQIRTLEISAH